MKNNFAVTLLAAALIVTGCGRKMSGDGGLPMIDVEAAIDNPRPFDLTEIADRIEFIPLDDSDDRGLVGSIGTLQESSSGFYICEGFMTPVQHFDKTGKYVSSFGRIGRGLGETTFIVDMTVDYGAGNVYIDARSPSVAAYDAAGRMFARSDSIPCIQILYHDGQLLALSRHNLRDPEAYRSERIAIVDVFSPDLKPVTSIDGPNPGPYDIMDRSLTSGAYNVGSSLFLSDNGKELIVRQGRNDTLYYYNKGALKPAWRLDLGRYAPPAEVYGLDPVKKWDENYFSVDNVWEGGRYLVVTADNRQRLPDRRLVFDKENLSAGFSATGPAGDPGLFLDGIAFTPCYIRDNRLVGYLRAFDIADRRDRITHPDLKTIAAALAEDSNPVLVIATLKK